MWTWHQWIFPICEIDISSYGALIWMFLVASCRNFLRLHFGPTGKVRETCPWGKFLSRKTFYASLMVIYVVIIAWAILVYFWAWIVSILGHMFLKLINTYWRSQFWNSNVTPSISFLLIFGSVFNYLDFCLKRLYWHCDHLFDSVVVTGSRSKGYRFKIMVLECVQSTLR